MTTNEPFSRRQFLSLAGYIVVVNASAIPLTECSVPTRNKGQFQFPQGVASADPQPNAIMLWTRMIADGNAGTSHKCTVQLAKDPEFKNTVAQKHGQAEAPHDFTVRFLIQALEPERTYYYRFLGPDGSTSRTGRTRTAPAPDAVRPVNIAVFSCQHFQCGFFGAYRRLVNDDKTAPSDRKIDFVLHLGDFIYESRYDQDSPYARDLQGEQLNLVSMNGTPRRLGPFPSGGAHYSNGPVLAQSLEDYRHLYRTYLLDPDLQEARAQFPFVCTWDDHEVINDHWQSYHPSGANQQRKLAGTHAWFDYIPAILPASRVGPGGPNSAREFIAPAKPVQDVEPQVSFFDSNYLSQEPNNLAVINSMSIFRYLQWGTLVDLFVLDERNYRGPRGVPEGLLDQGGFSGYPSDPIPRDVIETLSAGKTAMNGKPPERLQINGNWVINPRREYPVNSMLGAVQKNWIKQSLKNSGAKWKIMANSVPMLEFGFDATIKGGPVDGVLWSDSWDGYPIERKEIAAFLRDESIANVLSFSGDRHAHFAGLVPSYDSNGKRGNAVMVEFTGGDTASTSRVVDQEYYCRGNPELHKLVAFDGPKFGYRQKLMPALNAWLLFGAKAADKLASTGDPKAAMGVANAEVNPNLSYADTDGRGYFVAHFEPEKMTTEFVVIAEPVKDFGEKGPGLRRRVTYTVKSAQPGETPELLGPEIEGEAPLMGVKPLGKA